MCRALALGFETREVEGGRDGDIHSSKNIYCSGVVDVRLMCVGDLCVLLIKPGSDRVLKRKDRLEWRVGVKAKNKKKLRGISAGSPDG